MEKLQVMFESLLHQLFEVRRQQEPLSNKKIIMSVLTESKAE